MRMEIPGCFDIAGSFDLDAARRELSAHRIGSWVIRQHGDYRVYDSRHLIGAEWESFTSCDMLSAYV